VGRLVTPVAPVPVPELGRVHFIGLGGAGMSGIARIMMARGVPVSGSDAAPSDLLSSLAGQGASVYAGHAAANIDGADTVVVSTAIREDNPELAEARRRGLRILHRAAALASVMLGRRGIAVAGTHGKSTTTGMLTTILRHCGAGPGYVIGGILAETGLGAEDGTGDVFVAEADESDGSFLMLAPDLAIVTCVEADHLDNYTGLAEIEDAFVRFTRRITSGGLLIVCADDPGARQLKWEAETDGVVVRTYGAAADADYRLAEVRPDGMRVRFAVATGDGGEPTAPPLARLEIAVPGYHNALNATAAYCAALELGLPAEQIAAGLATYRGVHRRMQPKGEAAGVLVLDSYAHHPTELAADLRAAREIRPGGRVVAVFQPHLYSRTRIFAGDFGAALGLADQAFIMDVYAAREDPEPGVSGQLIASAVPGGRARFVPRREDVPTAVASAAGPGDLVLTMGAGDVTALGPLILAALAGQPVGAGEAPDG
jgi:UDP-N-acetylmuramate--alanine ligase